MSYAFNKEMVKIRYGISGVIVVVKLMSNHSRQTIQNEKNHHFAYDSVAFHLRNKSTKIYQE